MGTPKRQGGSPTTPGKATADTPSKHTPTRSQLQSSPSSSAKKRAAPTPKRDGRPSTERSLPSTSSPAPRAPPSTPVPTHANTSKSTVAVSQSLKSKSRPASSARPAASSPKGKAKHTEHEEAQLEDVSANSLVLETVESTDTTTRPSGSRKRSHSTAAAASSSQSATPVRGATPRSASRVKLQVEPEAMSEEEEDGHDATNQSNAAAPSSRRLASRPLPAAVAALLHQETSTKSGEAPSSSLTGGLRSLVEQTVLQTSTIAPDVSGIRCFAFNDKEDAVVVAREDGALIAYHLEYHQNVPHFTRRRHTGGCLRRTITRLAYVRVPVGDADAAAALGVHGGGGAEKPQQQQLYKEYLLASYLSGQLVFLDAETLFPVAVHQRTGGAIWDFCVASGQPVVYAAIADGSWHQLVLTLERYTPQTHTRDDAVRFVAWRPALVLERIVPGVPGADRALSVSCSAAMQLVVGTDDAGNVSAWCMRRKHDEAASSSAPTGASSGRAGNGLVDHESAWTTRLPKGIPLCCAISNAGRRPAVAVGTSMGDVVLLDADTGDVFATFSQHKGPVSTVTFDHDAFYASGWHDSLRAYRCSAEGEWYPAEVKRRTHYHEATQVSILPQRQLLLSSARDGTLLYAPLSQLFTAPAMYVRATKQQFALCREKNLLVQSRLNRVEVFRMDGACRHWSPLLSYTLAGHFHISHLWCDAALHHVLIATDDRVVLLKVFWREGAESALVVSRLEEVLLLPAGRGVIDACFAASPSSASTVEGSLYLLFDDAVVQVSLTSGYPTVTTPLASAYSSSSSSAAAALRPQRIIVVPVRSSSASASAASATGKSKASSAAAAHGTEPTTNALIVYGQGGTWRCELTLDGMPNTDTVAVDMSDSLALAQVIPALDVSAHTRTLATGRMLVGLSTALNRYVFSLVDGDATGASPANGGASSSPEDALLTLPRTLPHDCVFVAYMAIDTAQWQHGDVSLSALQRGAMSSVSELSRPKKKARTEDGASPTKGHTEYLLFGYFSKGILVTTRREWRMIHRCSMDTAAALKDDAHVLFVEQNLERTLEALPLCWKVRRFGN